MYWTAPEFRNLFDLHIPEWRKDNLYLRYAMGIPPQEVAAAHSATKLRLLDELRTRTGASFDPAILTIGFARRAAAYKRFDLLFTQPERVKK